MNWLRILRESAALATLLGPGLTGRAADSGRPVDRLQAEARGFYLLWSQGKADAEQILALPYVRGGQVVLQWAEVEPGPGRYDFAAIDAGLARFAAHGKRATLQINGNQKPAWLFREVPAVREKWSVQVKDAGGTLMFWHPRFQQAHLAMLEALARHLRASPHRAALLGLRLNFNAIGTEHLHVPAALAAPESWPAPPGVDRAVAGRFTPEAHAAYVDRVVTAYERGFADWTTVFVRNNLPAEVRARWADRFAAGRLAWFHTSSEAEPRSAGTERQYGTFLDDCRSGRTVAYAEPWASAWGEHGGGPDPRWCSPAQWNYWTMLLNLHCGVSFIGEYHANLSFALSGRHGRDAPVAPEAAGPREFRAAYTWGADYVGRHNRPAESPGAWVAFRANAVARAANPKVPAAGRRLQRFTGDYTWLAERVDDDGSLGVGPVGPAENRYGAFARRYAAGSMARIRLDADFLRTLDGPAVVRVIALGAGDGEIAAGGQRQTFQAAADRWSVVELPIRGDRLPRDARSAAVEVRTASGELFLHLIEVRRAPP